MDKDDILKLEELASSAPLWNGRKQVIIIDEAQNIKNHDTAHAKAIKTFKADNFIAMSGTPVENRLSELWSIVDYSNRGLLGSAKDFKEDYEACIYSCTRLWSSGWNCKGCSA